MLNRLNKVNKLDLIYMVLKMRNNSSAISSQVASRNHSFKQQFQKARSLCGN